MKGISIEAAYLFGTCLEIFFYGLNVVLFGITVHLLRNRHASIMLWTAISFSFILATTHVAISITMLVEAFTTFREMPGPGPYYDNQTSWINLLSLSVYGISIFVGECLVIWRCFILWRRKWWIIIIFGAMLCALTGGYASITLLLLLPSDVPSAACGIGTMITISRLTSQSTTRLVKTTVTGWYEAFSAISLSINIIISGLIVYYLLRFSRDIEHLVGGGHGRRYRCLALIILESTSIQPLFLIIREVIYLCGSQAHWATRTILVQINTIAPLLMIIATLSYKTEETTSHLTEPSARRRLSTLRFMAARDDSDGNDRNTNDTAELGHPPKRIGIAVDSTATVDLDVERRGE